MSSDMRHGWWRARLAGIAAGLLVALLLQSGLAQAAPRAALVMDMRTGEVLYDSNADARLHPASLTKMMTLYIAFQAVEHGEIALDDLVTISANVAAEPPSKLGLRAGQKIRLRYLIRAAAVKSANDAATAIAEAIGGTEPAFIERMNRTARAMGMTRTHFENAHGLDGPTHLSTARDMTILGRQLFYDFPDYFNLFSRITADAGIRRVRHTNRRFLRNYPGADGIKTGYTSQAGLNMTGTARRGSERIIATVFGYPSVTARNRRMAELLDLGFGKAPTRVAVRRPAAVPYSAVNGGRFSRRVRTALTLRRAPLPPPRPGTVRPGETDRDIEALIAQVSTALADGRPPVSEGDAPAALPLPAPRPARAPARLAPASGGDAAPAGWLSSSGGRVWAISLGQAASRMSAESLLLETALAEADILGAALRNVAREATGFDAQFVGLSQAEAAAACARLTVRGQDCEMSAAAGDG